MGCFDLKNDLSGTSLQSLVTEQLPTYGRQLNQHPHIHLSVTRGGLCLKHGIWRPIFFKKKIVGRYWRQAVITLLRKNYPSLNLPTAGYPHIRDYREWCQFLEAQFQGFGEQRNSKRR